MSLMTSCCTTSARVEQPAKRAAVETRRATRVSTTSQLPIEERQFILSLPKGWLSAPHERFFFKVITLWGGLRRVMDRP